MSKSLTERQILFIENFTSKSLNATQSAIKAGYSDKTAKQAGYELKKKLSNEIEQANRTLLNNAVPLAIKTLKDLIEDTKTPKNVVLGCINSVLDRNNYSGVIKTEDITHNKTDLQLQNELKHLLNTINIIDTPIIKIDLKEEEDTKH